MGELDYHWHIRKIIMKIHLTGTVWHGGLSASLVEGFEALGHDVHFFNEKGPGNISVYRKIVTRLARRPYEVDDKLREKIGALWIESIVEMNPDIIVLEYAPSIMPKFLHRARAFKRPILYWVTTPPNSSQSKELVLGMGDVDCIFTIDRQWMQFLERFSEGKDVKHLPLAGNENNFIPLLEYEEREKNNIYDLVFVGSFSPQDPSAAWRGYLLDSISGKYNVGVFGNGIPYWESYFPKLSTFARGGLLTVDALNELYNKTKIVLNIHSTDHLSSISARTFEIALSGAFQLVDFREDIKSIFQEDLFLSFKTKKEMNKMIEDWINTPEKRWQRAEAARNAVLEKHLWRHRAQAIIEASKKNNY